MQRGSRITRVESGTSRIARAVTLVGLMAACVPPGGTWSSQSGGTWSSQPDYQGQPHGSMQSGYSAQSGEYSGGDDDDGYATGPAASGSGGTCPTVCSRIAQCGLMSFDSCGELCGIAASNGHTWRIDQEPCSEIRKAFVTDQWMCRAEASFGTSMGGGPWEYSRESLLGTGNTRDDASYEAMRNCNAVMSMNQNLASSRGAAVDGGMCKVTRCMPPGSSLL
jgi:hypothetical protein